MTRPNITRVFKSPDGWRFLLNGRYSPGVYATRKAARERLKFHKSKRSSWYFDKAGAP